MRIRAETQQRFCLDCCSNEKTLATRNSASEDHIIKWNRYSQKPTKTKIYYGHNDMYVLPQNERRSEDQNESIIESRLVGYLDEYSKSDK